MNDWSNNENLHIMVWLYEVLKSVLQTNLLLTLVNGDALLKALLKVLGAFTGGNPKVSRNPQNNFWFVVGEEGGEKVNTFHSVPLMNSSCNENEKC